MSFEFSFDRGLRLVVGAMVLCLSTANSLAGTGGIDDSVKAPMVGRSSCDARDDCIDAILIAARDGRHIEQLLLTKRLESLNRSATSGLARSGVRPNRGAEAIAVGNVDVILTTILRGAMNDYAAIPDYRRALVLAYFKAGQVVDAERELRNAIASAPTYAAFWVDLAMILDRQGRTDDAVSALVVADSFTGRQSAAHGL